MLRRRLAVGLTIRGEKRNSTSEESEGRVGGRGSECGCAPVIILMPGAAPFASYWGIEAAMLANIWPRLGQTSELRHTQLSRVDVQLLKVFSGSGRTAELKRSG